MTWKNFPYPPPGRRLILVKEFSHFLISFFRSRMGRTSGASSEVKSLNNNFVLLRYTLGWQLCYVFEPGEWGFESRWKSDQQKQQRSSSVGKQILIILLLWFIVTCVRQTFLLSETHVVPFTRFITPSCHNQTFASTLFPRSFSSSLGWLC